MHRQYVSNSNKTEANELRAYPKLRIVEKGFMHSDNVRMFQFAKNYDFDAVLA